MDDGRGPFTLGVITAVFCPPLSVAGASRTGLGYGHFPLDVYRYVSTSGRAQLFRARGRDARGLFLPPSTTNASNFFGPQNTTQNLVAPGAMTRPRLWGLATLPGG